MSKIHTNATDEQLSLLDNLADDLAERTAQIPLAAQRIIKHSFPQVLENSLSNIVPSYVQMGRANLHWQLFLENRKGKLVFFFSKRKKDFDNSLTTNITFSISPAANRPPIPSTAVLRHFWAPPAFIELSPPRHLVRQVIQKTQDANPDNVLWLQLGADLLAIAFVASESFQRSNLSYFKNREAVFQLELAKKAPLEWFETMLGAIRPWVNGETSTPIPINLGRSEGEIQKILGILSDNFLAISQKMEDAYPNEDHPLQRFFPYYQLSDYSVNVRLRLTSEGKIIKEDLPEEETEEFLRKKEDLFQLEVLLTGAWEAGRPVVHFKILPPDFLTSGALFDAFLLELFQPKDEKKPAEHLAKLAAKLETTSAALENALTSNSPNAFIFRIQRKRKWDTQMFVLPIEENGQTRRLFFSADFEVDASNNSVTLRNSLSIDNLLKKKDDHFEMVHPGEKYFMRLMFHVNEWKNKVV